ncbi:hypothetical protein EXIGLDRAFT_783024 [Exidia glandulosa HHB12029]|uniref:Uncharacterized protein n=1 Tax=Exidia glandulosa HHB12029 TaxID=1314781 RepID=A0A166NAT5_EXIGL|nr:hypothetical protein EXIGLDRAFT_783024 [Exidia glandulosa HHB12029]
MPDSPAPEPDTTPASTKRRSKTAAQRREQLRRAALRATPTVEPTAPTTLLVSPQPAVRATSAPPTSSTAAGLAAIASAPSPTCSPPLAPLPARQLLALSTGPHSNPWRSIRTRKRRAHRPHRHERVARAEDRARHAQSLQRYVDTAYDASSELREAVRAALGPLYATLATSGFVGGTPATPASGIATDSPHVPLGRLLVQARLDDAACWEEIVHLGCIGAAELDPCDPFAGQDAFHAFGRLEQFWRDEFIAAHTALIADADSFDTHYLDDFKWRYVLGLSRWFLDGG